MLSDINCLIVDDELIAREILENHLGKLKGFNLKGSCKSALEAFSIMNTENIDLIFLDINMPEITGLSFAKSINKNVKVIFTTAYREYAVNGFDLQAVDYLLKPISFERFLQAVDKYNKENAPVEIFHKTSDENEVVDSFFVRSERKMVKIRFTEILYVESFSDYLKIHLQNKCIVTRETISNIEAKLPQDQFLRIHRSFVVAINRIDSYTTETLEVGTKELPISRGYKNEVLARLNRP